MTNHITLSPSSIPSSSIPSSTSPTRTTPTRTTLGTFYRCIRVALAASITYTAVVVSAHADSNRDADTNRDDNDRVTYTDNLTYHLKDHAKFLGYLTASSVLLSQSPRVIGSLDMALAVPFGIIRYVRGGWYSGVSAAASLGGIGWYNVNELSKDEYSKTRVFEKNMAIAGYLYVAIVSYSEAKRVIFSGYDNHNTKHASFISLTPDAHGLTWNYSYSF